jgi:hypothetical protein
MSPCKRISPRFVSGKGHRKSATALSAPQAAVVAISTAVLATSTAVLATSTIVLATSTIVLAMSTIVLAMSTIVLATGGAIFSIKKIDYIKEKMSIEPEIGGGGRGKGIKYLTHRGCVSRNVGKESEMK